MSDAHDIAKRLMTLLDEAAQREEEYGKIVKQLREDKVTQAREYLGRLEELHKAVITLTTKPREEPEFQRTNLLHMNSLKDKVNRDYSKTLYTVDDAERYEMFEYKDRPVNRSKVHALHSQTGGLSE